MSSLSGYVGSNPTRRIIIMPYKDAEVNRTYQREWARNNRETIMARRKARRNRYRQNAIDMCGGKCTECGSTNELQFHHVDPSTKIDTISRLIRNNGWEIVAEELTKCVLVCEECHDKVHW